MPVAGSTWVEGTRLKWIDSAGVVKSMEGLSLGVVAGAVKGSIWVQGEDIHYIDETTGARRYCTSVDRGVVAGAIKGSAWVEAFTHNIGGSGIGRVANNHTEDTIHIISEANKKRALHQDAPHTDGYMHSDYSYMHNDYSYMHNDYSYMHNDYIQYNPNPNPHGDGAYHSDGSLHSDGVSPHTDSYMHGDFIDTRGAHGDAGARGNPPHSDGGGMYYNNYYMHSDYSYMHSDGYSAHGDAGVHNDSAYHSDNPIYVSQPIRVNQTVHSDAPHSDSPT